MLKALSFLLVIFIAAGIFHYFSLTDPLKKLNVPYRFRIYRDSYGIPKIVTKDKESSFFARGYAEA